ncbi:hypothetical protein G0U57_001029 [Chelydra serpentina]|uniref:RING-type E3 ubiquitin transferase n=1 Tax=Chelydra serpentina TaxID=8475 RepID=A0A8T1S285_CHESE|nr:hypothetical protein G0U57_001029 [Chelydra serpentina]
MCRARILKENLRPNWDLARLAELFKDWNLCKKHQEKLNLFCEEDGETVCVVCERSPEHRSHPVLLMEEAAQKYQVGNTLDLGSFGPFLRSLI